MFVLEKVMPNGAVAQYHKAMKFEIHPGEVHAVLNSYHLPDLVMISWQDTYVIPEPFVVNNLQDVEVILTLPGAPFAGGSLIPLEAEPLEVAQAKAMAAVKTCRNKAEWGGVDTPLGAVDSDPDAQRKISGAVQMALLTGDTFSVQWRMADNSIVTHDYEATIQMGMLVGQHVAACQQRKNELDALITAAATTEEVEAIDCESGWPGIAEPPSETAPLPDPQPQPVEQPPAENPPA